mmetsp:Transcript_17766/g.62266  ORF Transcript_17766/g.62266 Transcript_17766/m.62266 type:complete len:777 (-) Transcript_17766:99-2429(-)
MDQEKKKEKKDKKDDAAEEGVVPDVVADSGDAGEPAKKEKKHKSSKSASPEASGDGEEAAAGDGGSQEAAEQATREAALKEEEEKKKAEEKETRKREKEEEKKRVEEEAMKASEEAKKAAEEARQKLQERLKSLVEGSKAPNNVEECIGELKSVVKEMQEAGIECQEIEEAEARIKELKKIVKAQEKLQQAISERDVRGLQKAIRKAEEAAVPEGVLEEARKVLAEELPKQEARDKLEALKEGATSEQLKEALAQAKSAGLKKDELAEFKELLGKLERRDEVEALLKKAMEERNVEGLKAAIQQAEEAGVDSKQIKKANKVLKEEEPKQKAREKLAQACEKPSIEVLKKAIEDAKEVGLEAAEYSKAEEQLKQEEEKERLMAAIKSTLAESLTVDMTDLEALRVAKEKLGECITTAMAAGVPEEHMVEADQRRKRLHNAIEDLKGSIRVFCRIRPLSSKEEEQGDKKVTEAASSMTLNIEGKDGGDPSTFAFDAVFTSGTQEEVFEDCRDLVQSAVDGYNVTIFAYGQTGAGKTFTMYGIPGQEGTTPRTIKELFRVTAQSSARFEFKIYASMLELYRNDLVDLLTEERVAPGKGKLAIKTDKAGRISVENLIEEECQTAEKLTAVLERGNKNRKVASTAMNAESSRSHLVLWVRILSTNKDTKEETRGKILMCDLAGSERLKKSQVEQEMQAEAIEINKSLTALGDVIEALTKNQKSVPYRNHKLTQLMQDSLGGSAKTLMFVNCSPASSNLDETTMSLKYATRAKKITNTAKKG